MGGRLQRESVAGMDWNTQEKGDSKVIIDTDVFIWYMRGNEKAYEAIEKANNFFMSVVTQCH